MPAADVAAFVGEHRGQLAAGEPGHRPPGDDDPGSVPRQAVRQRRRAGQHVRPETFVVAGNHAQRVTVHPALCPHPRPRREQAAEVAQRHRGCQHDGKQLQRPGRGPGSHPVQGRPADPQQVRQALHRHRAGQRDEQGAHGERHQYRPGRQLPGQNAQPRAPACCGEPAQHLPAERRHDHGVAQQPDRAGHLARFLDRRRSAARRASDSSLLMSSRKRTNTAAWSSPDCRASRISRAAYSSRVILAW